MADDAQDDLASTAEAYLAAPKIIVGQILWRDKGHQDFAEAKLPVVCAEMPEINGELVLTAHKTRVPQKFSFTLLAGSVRITGLDVNPASSHYNRISMQSVSSTHWQWFPDNEADGDDRELTHREWLMEFCARTGIELQAHYRPPPHSPVQLDLI
jgi:hypothetical protein